MSRLTQAAIAAAVAAAWMAGVHADERVYGAIHSLDNGGRATETVPIGSAELAKALDAGEIQSTESTTDGEREYAHDAANQTGAPEERPRPAIVNAAGEARARARAPAPLMDDAARAAEHMKYEADKKRRGG